MSDSQFSHCPWAMENTGLWTTADRSCSQRYPQKKQGYPHSCQQSVDNWKLRSAENVEIWKGTSANSISKVIHRFNIKRIEKKTLSTKNNEKIAELYTIYGKIRCKKYKYTFFVWTYPENFCGNVEKPAWGAGLRQKIFLDEPFIFLYNRGSAHK